MIKYFKLECGHTHAVKEGGRIFIIGENVRCRICGIEDVRVKEFLFAS